MTPGLWILVTILLVGYAFLIWMVVESWRWNDGR